MIVYLGTKEEGIFRVSGSTDTTNQVYATLNDGNLHLPIRTEVSYSTSLLVLTTSLWIYSSGCK
jgi:hypothetical protein